MWVPLEGPLRRRRKRQLILTLASTRFTWKIPGMKLNQESTSLMRTLSQQSKETFLRKQLISIRRLLSRSSQMQGELQFPSLRGQKVGKKRRDRLRIKMILPISQSQLISQSEIRWREDRKQLTLEMTGVSILALPRKRHLSFLRLCQLNLQKKSVLGLITPIREGQRLSSSHSMQRAQLTHHGAKRKERLSRAQMWLLAVTTQSEIKTASWILQ